jgi:molecular chaperone GrpE (heat shock protein)
MPRADVPPHTVLEEVEKGYLLFDKVIRHAKVVVSAAPAEEPVQQAKTENFED